jgi:tetratricopeptide (TPR) repeat protein
MGDCNMNMRSHNLKLIVSLFLIIITLAVFWQVRNHEFVNYDDDDYVTQNRHVQAGWTWEGVWRRKGRLDEAIGHFSEAVRIKPDFSEAMHYLKRALEEAGQLE